MSRPLGVLLAVVGLTPAVPAVRGLVREQSSWCLAGLLVAMVALVLTRLVASVSAI